MKKYNQGGFTLIEIIVVLIIVGILASIALPNLFSNVQTALGGAALQTAASMETPIEACAAKNNILPGTGNCSFTTILSNGTLATIAAGSNNFVIEVENAAGTPSGGTFGYELVGEDNGSVEAFDLNRLTTGVFSCHPGGIPYNNVC